MGARRLVERNLGEDVGAERVVTVAVPEKDVVLLLNHLEEVGPAVRDPDPRDRHKNAVKVTPAGVRVLKRYAELAEQADAELLAPLGAAEGRQLMELLTRVFEG